MPSSPGRRPGAWRVGTGNPRSTRGCADGGRWRAPAARQSRRAHIPAVSGVVSTAELAERVRDTVSTQVLVLHESATRPITEVPVAEADSLVLVVGPEGGIADDELAALSDAGAAVVRLGPTVLRTSTAAAVALGALGVLTPRWSLTMPAWLKHWDAPLPGGKLAFESKQPGQNPESRQKTPRDAPRDER